MRSFGLWYKSAEKSGEDPMFSVHINFWSESVKSDKSSPDLDVGLKISNFRNIDEVRFHCPFNIERNEVTDLIPALSKIANANLVFNADGSIYSKESYSVYAFEKNGSKEDLLLFPLNQNIENIYSLEKEDDKTDIVFNFSIFNKYLRQKQEFSRINQVYIRLRITSPKFKNSIYFDSEPLNKSFESAFSGTRILDFKINEKRNLGSKTIDKIEANKYLFPRIEDIHLLVMEPSSYDVESFPNRQMTCRELEGSLWNEYYGKKINYSKGRILAYHWRFEHNCSCLVKVKYSKTNFAILAAYILIVLALGIFSSTTVALVQDHWQKNFGYIATAGGLILFLLGLFLGRKKW